MSKLIALLAVLFSIAVIANAQSANELVGVWTIEKIENVSADGKRTPTFGDNPITQLVLTNNGRYSQFFMRSDIPKFASNNRLTGTPEEYAAVVKGSFATFGSYSVADKVVTLTMDGSTYPNWLGTPQKRPIVKLTADELVWTVPLATSGSGHVEAHWKRVK